MEISRIVITGGPCAGKSTAMEWIRKAITEIGYTVLFVPETATELISGGVAPWTCGTCLDYQKCQIKLQIEKENIFEQAARTMFAEKILIVCDRGLMDNKAYMTQEEFASALEYMQMSEKDFCDRYNAVFHLVSVAKGAQEYYTTDNNSARTETLEQAIDLDDKLVDAWQSHPYFTIIDNSCGFEEKMRRLIEQIKVFLLK